MPYPSRVRDLKGQTFNHLQVLQFAGKNKHRQALWKCLCGCGSETVQTRGNLVSGNTKSCGCKWEEAHTTHGHTKSNTYNQYRSTPTYAAWSAMKHRCKNPNNKHYADYGGRGITYTTEWERFDNFLADMGEKPVGMTLDRRDNQGDYDRENCRWVPNAVQQQNRRNNRTITVNGETHCIAEWARRWGLERSVLRARLERGWPIAELSKPSQVLQKGAQ